jgi:hypothetical protein
MKIIVLLFVITLSINGLLGQSTSKSTPQQTLFTGFSADGSATALSFSIYKAENGKVTMKMIYEQELYNVPYNDVLCFKPGASSILIDLNRQSYWRLGYMGSITCSKVDQVQDSKNYDHTLTVYFDLDDNAIQKLKANRTTEIIISFSERQKLSIAIDTIILQKPGSYSPWGSKTINPQNYFIDTLKNF